MKVATWNVNSVKARKDRLLAFLARESPDLLCLQELKVQDDKFPREEVQAAGYHAAVHGQKTYNGVAILAREPLDDVVIGLDDDVDDPQARFIAARGCGVRIASVYVPNGGGGDERLAYKLAWFERLLAWLQRHCDPSEPLLIGGDYNVAPDEKDVARPEQWNDTVLCVPEVRTALQRLVDWGLVDCLRAKHPEGGVYSWWDYRMLGFPKNNGLRIDHILATRALADRCDVARVDRNERKGKLPSDHAPVICEFG
jgi:exodeoxyribonuclease-3